MSREWTAENGKLVSVEGVQREEEGKRREVGPDRRWLLVLTAEGFRLRS